MSPGTVRRRLGIRSDPERVFRRVLARATHSFWLRQQGLEVMGCADEGAPLVTDDVYATLDAELGARGCADAGAVVGASAGAPARSGAGAGFSASAGAGAGGAAVGTSAGAGPVPGWFGWLGYEDGARDAGAEPAATDPVLSPAPDRAPRSALMRCSRLIVVDPATETVELVWLAGDAGAEDWARAVAENLTDASPEPDPPASALPESLVSKPFVPEPVVPEPAAPQPVPEPAAQASVSPASPSRPTPPRLAEPARWRHSDARYLELIRECLAAIRRGDAYQLCLTNEAVLPGRVDPLELHLRLRQLSPAPQSGLIRFGATALVSSSPEQFLTLDCEGGLATHPIKGTRPRDADQERDRALAEELRADPKERAENLMIVDLMRNDLSRVCELGSVVVTGLFEVRSHPQVHQLVSTVQGRLRPGLTIVDALRACFPAGSMTGAPKPAAIRILRGLEGGPRGAYAGCYGSIGFDGTARLAMTIRTVVVGPGAVSIGAGGGITSASDPERELAEVRLKASVLIDAVRELIAD